MVYITSTGRRLPDKIRFDPEEARRVIPKKLMEHGLVTTLEEGKRAVEIVIASDDQKSEPGGAVGNQQKSE